MANLITRIQDFYDESYDDLEKNLYEIEQSKWKEFLFNLVFPEWYRELRQNEWNEWYWEYTKGETELLVK